MNPDATATLFMILVAYFLPWLVAIIRSHHQRGAIAVLNLFLGWTGLGWVVALIWAVSATRGDSPESHHA